MQVREYNLKPRLDSRWFFFFSSRRRHTRLQGDWSSDVCSSDLARRAAVEEGAGAAGGEAEADPEGRHRRCGPDGDATCDALPAQARGAGGAARHQIGRAAGRGRGEISGGARSFKKKKEKKDV